MPERQRERSVEEVRRVETARRNGAGSEDTEGSEDTPMRVSERVLHAEGDVYWPNQLQREEFSGGKEDQTDCEVPRRNRTGQGNFVRENQGKDIRPQNVLQVERRMRMLRRNPRADIVLRPVFGPAVHVQLRRRQAGVFRDQSPRSFADPTGQLLVQRLLLLISPLSFLLF